MATLRRIGQDPHNRVTSWILFQKQTSDLIAYIEQCDLTNVRSTVQKTQNCTFMYKSQIHVLQFKIYTTVHVYFIHSTKDGNYFVQILCKKVLLRYLQNSDSVQDVHYVSII